MSYAIFIGVELFDIGYGQNKIVPLPIHIMRGGIPVIKVANNGHAFSMRGIYAKNRITVFRLMTPVIRI